jgi:hypothetical protein
MPQALALCEASLLLVFSGVSFGTQNKLWKVRTSTAFGKPFELHTALKEFECSL